MSTILVRLKNVLVKQHLIFFLSARVDKLKKYSFIKAFLFYKIWSFTTRKNVSEAVLEIIFRCHRQIIRLQMKNWLFAQTLQNKIDLRHLQKVDNFVRTMAPVCHWVEKNIQYRVGGPISRHPYFCHFWQNVC